MRVVFVAAAGRCARRAVELARARVLARSDRADSLRDAILARTVLCLVAAGLFLLSSDRLKRDWE